MEILLDAQLEAEPAVWPVRNLSLQQLTRCHSRHPYLCSVLQAVQANEFSVNLEIVMEQFLPVTDEKQAGAE
jgi:hypothetical protein